MDASLALATTVDPVGLVVAAAVVLLSEAVLRRRRARAMRQDAE
jgi:hypothetical protein